MAAPNTASESVEAHSRASATSSQAQEPGYSSRLSQSTASAAGAGNSNSTITDDAQKHHAVSAAKLVSASPSLSEGSDSEAVKQDGKPQSKSAAVKKPATFKAVSVNKTFLAAKGPASAPQLKANDKSVSSSAASTPPTTSTLPAGRPRLIAKSGGNGSVPKFTSSSNGRVPTSEPTGVWNKNRPAAPATPPVDPSKLTDEDLKKDGIHVASRLQTDDSRTSQSNWADIEDDDDDWASETIEWTDGTKTTLPHTDETQPSPIPRPATPPKPKAAPTATPSLGSGRPGLILRGSGDRPSLVAKVHPPVAPTKSPWATLPSVEKVSPAAPYMPTPHQSQQRHSSNNYQNQSQGHGYNNHMSHDSYPRNLDPALDRRNDYGHQGMMQRSRQNSFNDHNNASGYPPRQMPNDGPYSRDRRGSMNMGYGPGRYHQMSGPPPNYHNMHYNNSGGGYGPRRPSFNDGPPPMSPRGNGYGPGGPHDSPNFGGPHGPPHGPHHGPPAHGHHLGPPQGPHGPHGPHGPSNEPIDGPPNGQNAYHEDAQADGTQSDIKDEQRPHQQAQWNSPQSQGESQASSVIPEEETAEFQKKLMRERAEEAMRRRQEQEAREEAAKQERLRRKLEALGPAPERQSAKKQTPVVSKAQPETAESTASKTPIPEAILARKDVKADASSPVVPPAVQPVAQKGSSSRPESSSNASPHAQKQPKIWEASGAATHAQSAGPPPSRGGSMGSGWGSGGTVVHPPRNVWGAPNNDRGLGNGTFITDMATIPGPGTVHNGPAAAPAPIGPPGNSHPHAGSRDAQGYDAGSRQRSLTSETERRPAWIAPMHQADSATNEAEKKQVDIDLPPSLLKSTWRNTPEPEPSRDFQAVAPGSSSGPVQPRPSRFFPTRDSRPIHGQHSAMVTDPVELRVRSPSPPPPIAEDHPVYDGDPSQPNVSFPKPHPIVRLPPVFGSAQSESPKSPTATTSSASGHWQSKINNLLSGHKPQPRRNSVDPTSPNAQFARPVSRGHSAPTVQLPQVFEATTMPMSTDCFEEPEMGSLPRICLPKEAPEVAWNPAVAQTKPLPRRFAILNNTSSAEPDFYEPSGQIRIHMVGMAEAKFVYHASACGSRTQSRGSGGQSRSRRGNGNKGVRSENKQSAASNNATLAPPQPPAATTPSRGTNKQVAPRPGSHGPGTNTQQPPPPRQQAEGRSGNANNATVSDTSGSNTNKAEPPRERDRGEQRTRRDAHAPREHRDRDRDRGHEALGGSSAPRGGYRGRGSEWGRRGGSVSNRASHKNQTAA